MKGKTGKPNAMRGGGMARKGVGMALASGGAARNPAPSRPGIGVGSKPSNPTSRNPAPSRPGIGVGSRALKGGGMARKGTGSKAEPGGKKMAMGGPTMERKPAPPGSKPPVSSGPGSRPIRGVLGVTRPGGLPVKPDSGRPSIRPVPGGSSVIRPGGPQIGGPQIGGPLMPPRGPEIGGPLPLPRPDYQVGMPAPGYSLTGMKKGGKVSKYAKGGAVKMTAGAGSGSGRLEKVAAHKGAKRVPAANLKSGGKVKGK